MVLDRAGNVAGSEAGQESWTNLLTRIGLLLILLFAFFVGLDLMGLSFKLFGKGFAETLIERTSRTS